MVLRQEVFVVEQDCPYLDADGKDQNSYHVLAYDENTLAAYARIVKPGVSYTEWAIGRVIVKSTHRNQKLGYKLMEQCHKFLAKEKWSANSESNLELTDHLSIYIPPIRLSAQSHLEKFYTNCGYKPTGKEYLEDGIPHKEMLRL
ncbi:MAG: GNAT family N-acetyltransferase [Bacteroidia bacterium]